MAIKVYPFINYQDSIHYRNSCVEVAMQQALTEYSMFTVLDYIYSCKLKTSLTRTF